MKQIGIGRLRAGAHLAARQLSQAFEQQHEVMRGVIQLLKSKEKGRWLLRPLRVTVRDLRELAYRTDDLAGKDDSTNTTMDDVRDAFSACVSDRNADVKESLKRASLMLMSNLLSITFRLNNVATVQTYIKMIQPERMKSMYEKNGFSLADHITFKYYLGRNAMFQANYTLANECLSYAFDHCHRESSHNKRLILVYLTPVKLRLGQLPTDELLRKYNLPQFAGLSHAVRTGNLKQLKEELAIHQSFFVRWGIFMTLEKLRFIAYRNLFKRVFSIVVAPGESPHVPLASLQTAINTLQDRQIDLDEVECIVANLIHKKYIKGFISHSKRLLVMSRKDAFPLLKNVPAF